MSEVTLPKLTIVTPSFNLGKYIERTIRSVLDQEYDNFEYIVIDGGSTDNTLDILKNFSANKAYKNKFKWISEPDKGQTDAINKGLKMSTGDWFAWINADDFYEPGSFKEVAEEAKRKPNSGVIYGNCRTHTGNTSIVEIPPSHVSFKSFDNGCVIFGPSTFYNRKAIEDVGSFDQSLDLWMDYDMYMRIAKKYEFDYINKVLAHFMLREDQKSRTKNNEKRLHKEAYNICRKNGGPIFSRLLLNCVPKWSRRWLSLICH